MQQHIGDYNMERFRDLVNYITVSVVTQGVTVLIKNKFLWLIYYYRLFTSSISFRTTTLKLWNIYCVFVFNLKNKYKIFDVYLKWTNSDKHRQTAW